jgi:hypothetical protein
MLPLFEQQVHHMNAVEHTKLVNLTDARCNVITRISPALHVLIGGVVHTST